MSTLYQTASCVMWARHPEPCQLESPAQYYKRSTGAEGGAHEMVLPRRTQMTSWL